MFRYLLAAMFWFSMPVSATEPVVPPPTPTQILALPAELRADFHQRVLDGKVILIIDIPQAPRDKRPVFLKRDPFTNTYIRTLDGDRDHARYSRRT